MAAACRLVHSPHHPIRGYRVFRDWTNPLDVYDDIKLFLRFRFPRRELLEVIDDFEGDATFKLKPFFLFFLFFSTLSAVQGTLPVAFKASVMLAPTLAFSRFLAELGCFD